MKLFNFKQEPNKMLHEPIVLQFGKFLTTFDLAGFRMDLKKYYKSFAYAQSFYSLILSIFRKERLHAGYA